jgi:hypothetical protein
MSLTPRLLVLLFLLPVTPLQVSGEKASGQSGENMDVKDEDEEPILPARQNLLLRAYFRKQYLNMRTDRFDLNESFMERYVDRQIDHFVETLEELVERLKQRLRAAEEAHRDWSTPEDDGRARARGVRFAKALKEVGDTAGDIRGKLSHVFFQLDGKERLPIEIASQGSYEEEMAYLRTQVEEAVARISDYMFDSTYTVPYENLKKKNMIIRLYWAEETADRIRERLPR